jgi:hypothetical protein
MRLQPLRVARAAAGAGVWVSADGRWCKSDHHTVPNGPVGAVAVEVETRVKLDSALDAVEVLRVERGLSFRHCEWF